MLQFLFTDNITVRLVGGTNFSGRVEVSKVNSDSWRGVCDDDWDDNDAKVVCKMIDPRLDFRFLKYHYIFVNIPMFLNHSYRLFYNAALSLRRPFQAAIRGLEMLAVITFGLMTYYVMVMRRTYLNVNIKDGEQKTVKETRQPKLYVPVIKLY